MWWSEALWHSFRLLLTFWLYIRRRIIETLQCPWLDVWVDDFGDPQDIVEGGFAESFWENIVIGVVALTHWSVAAAIVILWWSWVVALMLLFIWDHIPYIWNCEIWNILANFNSVHVADSASVALPSSFSVDGSTGLSSNSVVNTSQCPSVCSSTSSSSVLADPLAPTCLVMWMSFLTSPSNLSNL